MTVLSVTIPTKDRPALLERALISVLNQSDDLEVTVVDDGSTTEHAKQIEIVCSAYDRVTLLRNEVSRGPSHARNRGLSNATGDYWCALDDDDQWLPGKWQTQYELLADYDFPADLVALCAMTTSRPEQRGERLVPVVTALERFDSLTALFGRLPVRVFLNTYVAPTALMRSIGGYDERLRWGEHTDVLLRLSDAARFIATDHVGVLVDRWHPEAASRAGLDLETKIAGIRLLLDKHAARFAAEPGLRAKYRHILALSLLRDGHRFGAIMAFGTIVLAGPGIKRRARALGHLLIALLGGRRLWRLLQQGRGSGDEPSVAV